MSTHPKKHRTRFRASWDICPTCEHRKEIEAGLEALAHVEALEADFLAGATNRLPRQDPAYIARRIADNVEELSA